jgi:hypothetical protein
MGIDVTSHVCYGQLLNENDLRYPWIPDDPTAKVLSGYSGEYTYSYEDLGFDEAMEYWFANLDEDSPVGYLHFGSGMTNDGLWVVLAVSKTVVSMDWNEQTLFKELRVDDADILEAQDFCRRHEIPWDDPKWYAGMYIS